MYVRMYALGSWHTANGRIPADTLRNVHYGFFTSVAVGRPCKREHFLTDVQPKNIYTVFGATQRCALYCQLKWRLTVFPFYKQRYAACGRERGTSVCTMSYCQNGIDFCFKSNHLHASLHALSLPQ